MQVKSGMEQKYQALIEISRQSVYNQALLRYMERWADLMESEFSVGSSLPDIAEDTSRRANTESITKYQHEQAVEMLAKYWSHGDVLLEWHEQHESHFGPGPYDGTPACLKM